MELWERRNAQGLVLSEVDESPHRGCDLSGFYEIVDATWSLTSLHLFIRWDGTLASFAHSVGFCFNFYFCLTMSE